MERRRAFRWWLPGLLLLPILLGLALSRSGPPSSPAPTVRTAASLVPTPTARGAASPVPAAWRPSAAHPGYAWVRETADPGLYTGAGSSLALDAQDNPHIAYQQNYLCDLRYAYLAGGRWFTETVDAFGITGIMPALVLDAQDHPHIAYRIGGDYGDLLYARNAGSGWYTQTIDAWGDTGVGPSLQQDGQGCLHVGYYNQSGCVMYAYQDATTDGAAWPHQVVSCGPYWYGQMLTLDLDNQDRPHLAFISGYDTDDLLYAWPEAGGWRIETVDSAGDTGYYPALVLDPQDHPHVSYHDDTRDALKYAWHDGAAWHIVVVDDNGYNVGLDSSLALDAQGRPHISYYHEGADELRYAWFDGTAWRTEVVDADRAGQSSALVLDAQGRPRISYRGGGHLRYARLVLLPYAVYVPWLER